MCWESATRFFELHLNAWVELEKLLLEYNFIRETIGTT